MIPPNRPRNSGMAYQSMVVFFVTRLFLIVLCGDTSELAEEPHLGQKLLPNPKFAPHSTQKLLDSLVFLHLLLGMHFFRYKFINLIWL